MWRQTLISFLATLLIVLAVGFYLLHRGQWPQAVGPAGKKNLAVSLPLAPEEFKVGQPELPDVVSVQPQTTPMPAALDQLLIAAGWPKAAADKIQNLDQEWFDLLAGSDPVAANRELTLLKGLADYGRALAFVEKHPETAGLIAAATDPAALTAILESAGQKLPMLLNLFVLQASPSAAHDLSEALRTNSDIIIELYRRGLIGSEILFIFNRQDKGMDVYESWLAEIIGNKLAAPTQELASTINMLLKYGPEIRTRLRNNPEFRRKFRGKIWPKLARVASSNHNLFDIYLDDSRIWDLLMLDQGELLLQERGLLVPVDLLFGYPEIDHTHYPEELHPKVIQALLNGDMVTIQALMKFRGEPLFHDLLRRHLPPEILTTALNRLFEAQSDYPRLLAEYNTLSEAALAEEIGPAPGIMTIWTPFYYTVWEVPKKLIQGRSPTTSEWFNSIADPASFLLPLLKIGVAVVNLGKTISTPDQDENRDIQQQHTIGMNEAEEQLGREVAANLSEAELINFRITAMLTRLQEEYVKHGTATTPFEITKPLLFMFDYSGEGGRMANIHRRFGSRLIWFPGKGFAVQINNEENPTPASAFFSRQVVEVASGDSPEEARRKNIAAWWLLLAGDPGK